MLQILTKKCAKCGNWFCTRHKAHVVCQNCYHEFRNKPIMFTLKTANPEVFKKIRSIYD